MTTITFTVYEYDRDRPHVVVREFRDSVELDNPMTFWAWANEHYPHGPFRVDVDIGQGL